MNTLQNYLTTVKQLPIPYEGIVINLAFNIENSLPKFGGNIIILKQMFTGIIEATAVIKSITQEGSNKTYLLESELSKELKVDQSLAHNGVCLTVTEIVGNVYSVTAIAETLLKTTLNEWVVGQEINLERSMSPSNRFDGHIVQGHVDSIALCTSSKNLNGSWEFVFEYDLTSFGHLIVEKGSICLDGISLTVFNIKENMFTVGIIPYTFNHTSLKFMEVGKKVNVEFDIIGKYLDRKIQLHSNGKV